MLKSTAEDYAESMQDVYDREGRSGAIVKIGLHRVRVDFADGRGGRWMEYSEIHTSEQWLARFGAAEQGHDYESMPLDDQRDYEEEAYQRHIYHTGDGELEHC